MEALLRIIHSLTNQRAYNDEYYGRFIEPHVICLKALGVSPDECQSLIRIAMKVATPQVIGHAPGSILANMTDHIEAGDVTAAQIIADQTGQG